MAEQRNAEWVSSASPEERARAFQAGELAHYMGGKTDDERAHEAYVNGSADRLYAQALGFATHPQMAAMASSCGSTMLEAKRRDLTPEQREKLEWLESATPQAAYAAEQAGELNNLLGRDVTNEAARLAEVGQKVRDAMGGLNA